MNSLPAGYVDLYQATLRTLELRFPELRPIAARELRREITRRTKPADEINDIAWNFGIGRIHPPDDPYAITGSVRRQQSIKRVEWQAATRAVQCALRIALALGDLIAVVQLESGKLVVVDAERWTTEDGTLAVCSGWLKWPSTREADVAKGFVLLGEAAFEKWLACMPTEMLFAAGAIYEHRTNSQGGLIRSVNNPQTGGDEAIRTGASSAAEIDAHEPPAPTPEMPEPIRPQLRRVRRGRSLRDKDRPLIEEMRADILAGRASGAMDAARKVVDRGVVEGKGTDESKVKRLSRFCLNQFPDLRRA